MKNEIRPARSYIAHFDSLSPTEQGQMATLFVGVVSLVAAKLAIKRQIHCDRTAARLLEEIDL